MRNSRGFVVVYFFFLVVHFLFCKQSTRKEQWALGQSLVKFFFLFLNFSQLLLDTMHFIHNCLQGQEDGNCSSRTTENRELVHCGANVNYNSAIICDRAHRRERWQPTSQKSSLPWLLASLHPSPSQSLGGVGKKVSIGFSWSALK